MFSSLGLFSSVACPEGVTCSLLNCIFLHPDPTDPVGTSKASQKVTERPRSAGAAAAEPPRKRQRTDEDGGEAPQPPAAHARASSELGRDGSAQVKAQPKPRPAASQLQGSATPARPKASPAAPTPLADSSNATPARCDAAAAAAAGGRSDESPLLAAKRTRVLKAEPLAPRLLPKAPAPHATRHQLLALVFDQYARLNELVKGTPAAKLPFKAALELSQREMIRGALDEEERVARAQPALYGNVLKLRIVALRKMGLAEWRAEREKQLAKEFPGHALTPTKPPRKDPVSLETGLSAVAENALLADLLTPLAGLDKHGYVLAVPEPAAIEEARRAVEAADGWEHCDRCRSRFQVFPGRRTADGALAGGGACTYHHGKPRRPLRDRGATAAGGPAEAQYTCCLRDVGTPGCTTAATHVYKAAAPTRLSLATPFAATTAAGDRATGAAVCMDCEMAYTTHGLELVRLTVTAWPGGAPLADALVRPVGELLDLNTRFSGVTAAAMTAGAPCDPLAAPADAVAGAAGEPLPLLGSPADARALLLRYLAPDTPLIGHALENDLNAVRLVHPTVIDTVLLYPHPRGLPVRHGLRALVDRHLGRQIQTAGEHGHDSKEDARAAGDLVRLRVAETWRRMQREGWAAKDGVLCAPDGRADVGEALERHMKA